ncbi:Clan MA, family M8 [Tritrichomonas foetus]|uniref:Clan MA, family M8 n=1 Tax=Tritrichomonas foetus TaxID=1144522 RepID=A0A1J4K3M3_9EUKA|nr:Clan MA, family M8 [Tritrichomonas foetus]|eukprot:OHT05975.1 Clan MA, family M8 [Tritrichomonas foetus]
MLTLLFALLHVFTCDHTREIDAILRSLPPQPLQRSTNSIETNEGQLSSMKDIVDAEVAARQPIRVYFSVDSIDNPSLDSQQCKVSGETLKVDGRGYITCQAGDILTENKKKVIKETMENARKFIHKLIKVTPCTDPIDVSGTLSGTLKDSNTKIPNIDLFIYVLARPYGNKSSTLASASPLKYNTNKNSSKPLDSQRPLVGKITINAAKMPETIQDENSGERQFFVTCIHELMHVLAFSPGLFTKWVNRSSGTQFKKHVVEFKNNYNITQTFLGTPALTKWVNTRFQVTDPVISTFGLEIEDGGGPGTRGSHPNSRLYFSDVMQGVTYGPGYFSPVFFHSLYDSGWYEPNYTMVEPLVYMDVTLYGQQPNPNVLTNPASTSFPSDYFCDSSFNSYCFYDYSTKANCDLISFDEVASQQSSLSNETIRAWYGANGKYSSAEVLDYLPIYIPNVANCRNSDLPNTDNDVGAMAKKMGETYSPTSVCAISKIFKGSFGEVMLAQATGCYSARCGMDGKLRITLPNTDEQMCVREGQKIYKKASTQYVLCPSPARACATLPKTPMLPVTGCVPDRGPHDGSNYISIEGSGFDQVEIESILIGDIPLTVISTTPTSLLVQVPSKITDKTTPILEKPLPLKVVLVKAVAGYPKETVVENFYTFLKKDYSYSGN